MASVPPTALAPALPCRLARSLCRSDASHLARLHIQAREAADILRTGQTMIKFPAEL
jgi:hypothetical protein